MGDLIGFAFLFVIFLAGYWSFVILPRQRMFRKHNKLVQTMNIGDEVITAGGIIGTIARLEADRGVAHVTIAEGIEVRVLTSALSRPFDAEEIAITSQLGVDPAADQKLRERGAH
jgi:preprotein translocase subunit YajC